MSPTKYTIAITALVATVFLSYLAGTNSSPARANCHDNLTCDGDSYTCYSIDGSNECVRKVERVDARKQYCMDVADARGCFSTLTECTVARGVVVSTGGVAGECLKVPYPKASPKR